MRQTVDKTADGLRFTLVGPIAASSPSSILRVIGVTTNSSIRLYHDQDCKRIVNQTELTGGIHDIEFNFVLENDYQFFYKIITSNQIIGNCKNTGLTYRYDASAPAAPTIGLVGGTFYSANARPTFSISGLIAGDEFTLFSDNNCDRQVLNFTATSSASVLKQVPVNYALPEDGSYTFYYKLKDLANNYRTVSSETCLNAGLAAYTLDRVRPAMASNFVMDPSISLTPESILYISEMGSSGRVEIFTDSTCTVRLHNTQTDGNEFMKAVDNNTMINYYFKHITAQSSSACLRVWHYLPQNSAGNSTPLFQLIQKGKDNNLSFNITANGIETNSTIIVYPNRTCTGMPLGAVTSSGSSVNVALSFVGLINGDYPLYYIIYDQAYNPAIYLGRNCQNTGLAYQLDSQSPASYNQKLIAPSRFNTSDQNVVVTDVTESLVTIQFKSVTNGQLIKLYNAEYCTGTLVSNQTVSVHQPTIEFPLAQAINNKISYQIDSGLCVNYDLKPIKKDGIEKQVTFLFNNLEIGSTLTIYPDSSCATTNLYSQVIEASQQSVTVTLDDAKEYAFATTLTDPSGNTTSCNALDEYSNTMTYRYYKLESLALGENHSCATMADPTNIGQFKTFCWGRNDFDQLGLSGENSALTPTELANISAKAVSTYSNTTCYIDTSNELYCFGKNYGQTPVFIGSNFNQIVLGENHGCGLLGTNEVACFGDDSFGQIGNGLNPSPGLNTTATLAQTGETLTSGHHHSCVLNSSGHYSCWGAGTYGQLGYNTFLNANSPHLFTSTYNPTNDLTLFTDYNFVKISAGTNFSCALTSSDNQYHPQKVFCWGSNENNQLQSDNPNMIARPQLINGDNSFIDIASSNQNTCAIDSENSLYCWGAGYQGLKMISSGLKFQKVFAGKYHHCAEALSGEIYCFGQNQYGQLGNGKTQSSSTPQKVDFDFDQAKLLIENDQNEIITAIDLKYHHTTKEDLTFHYDNNQQSYFTHTLPQLAEIEYTIILNNIGQSSATINAASLKLSPYTSSLDQQDYTSQFSLAGEIGDAGFCAATLSGESSCELKVIFKPTLPRPEGMSVYLEFSYSDSDKTYHQQIKVTGYSRKAIKNVRLWDETSEISSQLTFNQDNDFINATLNETRTKLLTIKNEGLNAITITLVNLLGDNIDQFAFTGGSYPGLNGNCQSTIAALGSCTIEIIYAPNQDSELDGDSGVQAGLKIALKTNTESDIIYIPFEAYSEIYWPTIDILDENATEISPLSSFNNLLSAISTTHAGLTKTLYIQNVGDPNDTTETYADVANLQVNIIGSDAVEFTFTGGAYPGINGTCTDTLVVGDLCAIEVIYKPINPIATDFSFTHKAQLEITLENAHHSDPVDPIILNIHGYVNP